jgi:hypothetical protein
LFGSGKSIEIRRYVFPGCLAVETADAYCSQVLYFRLVLWVTFFAIATFCWVVVIEHGPEDFIEGTKIEIENLGWFTFRFFK